MEPVFEGLETRDPGPKSRRRDGEDCQLCGDACWADRYEELRKKERNLGRLQKENSRRPENSNFLRRIMKA